MILLVELPIGLDLGNILWHLLNFVILLVGIRFLLYKPIKNFISKREKEYKDIQENNRMLKEQSKAEKLKYEELVNDAESQIAKIAEETAEITKKNAAVILEQARAEAKAIVEQAKAEAEQQLQKVMPEIKERSSELAIAISEKILSRKITEKDMDKLIDDCISNWSNK